MVAPINPLAFLALQSRLGVTAPAIGGPGNRKLKKGQVPQMFMAGAQAVGPQQKTTPVNMFASPLAHRAAMLKSAQRPEFKDIGEFGDKPKPEFNWADLAGGIGMGLLTGKDWGEGLASGLGYARQFGQERQDREDRELRRQELIDRKADRAQAEMDKKARVEGYNMFLQPLLDDDPANDPQGLNLSRQQAQYLQGLGPDQGYDALNGIMFPKDAGPQSAYAKMQADVNAGLVPQSALDQWWANETRPPQGPQAPETWSQVTINGRPMLQSSRGDLKEVPGQGGGPFEGTGLDNQAMNILLTGDPASPEYAAAHAHLSEPKVQFDATTGRLVAVQPNLGWAVSPGGSRGAPDQATGPRVGPTVQNSQGLPTQPVDPLNSLDTFNLPGATVTSTPGKSQFNETQGKVATFADRIGAANDILAGTEKSGTSLLQKGMSNIPVAGNFLMSADRQKFEQAERDFINAVLRRESGAVISDEEFSNARQQYIPQPGDSEEVLRQKKASRARALEGFIRESGPSYKPAPSGLGAAPQSGGTRVLELPPGNWE